MGQVNRSPLAGFQKGHKHNSYAQSRIRELITERAREAGLDALNLWIETMNNKEESIQVRLKCSELIVDRAIGKAVDMVAIASLGGSGDTPELLNTQALLALVQSRIQADDSVVSEVPPPSV